MINKTKIICTIGPASIDVNVITEMIKNGMNCARLNFSHGDYNFHKAAIKNIRTASKKCGIDIPILQDLQGPKIRIGKVQNNSIVLRENDIITISIKEIIGNNKIISTNYKGLIRDLKINDLILIDDGKIKLVVKNVSKDAIKCLIIKGGILSNHKGINLPNSKLRIQSITKKDYSDIDFGIKNNIDIISLSFIRQSADIIKLKKYIKARGINLPVIAKIERPEAIRNIDDIIKYSDGIMVARGDLGVELSPERVPILQKEIISKSNKGYKFVITATQMLESMIKNQIPTRAEASDVANAILDGTDCVMLSAETSIGSDPTGTVKMMSKIINSAEIIQTPRFNYLAKENSLISTLCYHASDISQTVDASAIITFTKKGKSSVYLSNLRARAKIFAISSSDYIYNRDMLMWGIFPIKETELSLKHKREELLYYLVEKKYLKRGDKVIIIYNSNIKSQSSADTIRIVNIK